jgi:mannosyltransferase
MRRGWIPAAIGALAAAARLPHAWSDSLWQDEVASARILREPTFASMLHRVVQTESTPPLWYSLGWLLHEAGASILDVRLLSVAAGAATAAVVVVLAREVLPLRLAIVAGLLAAFGRSFLAHGHELRAYALLAFVCVAFAWALQRRNLVAIAACTAAGALTHYFFAFTLLAGCVWIAFEPELRGRRRALAAAIAAGLVAASPWLPSALVQYRQDRFWWIGPFSLRAVVETPLKLFAPTLPIVVSLGFIVLCVLGAVQLWRTSAKGRLYVLLAAGPLLAAAAAWAAGQHVYAERNLIGIGPFVALLAAAALAQLPRHARAAAAVTATAAIAFGFFSFGTAATAAPFNDIARMLVREGWRSADPIAVFGGMPQFFSYRSPLEWYLPRQPQLALGLRTDRACSTVFAVVQSRAHAQELSELGHVESHWIDGYDVLRLHLRGWPPELALGRPTLITATADHARCVAPDLSGRLKPLA